MSDENYVPMGATPPSKKGGYQIVGGEEEQYNVSFADLDEALTLALEDDDIDLANAIADDIEQKRYDKQYSTGETMLEGAADSAALGFGDEFGAGVYATLNPALSAVGVGGRSEGDWQQRYEGARDRTRERQDTMRRDRPAAYTTGELAGGLATGGTGLAKATAKYGATKAAMIGGGSLGGVYGLGASKSDPVMDSLAAITADEGEQAALRERLGEAWKGAGEDTVKGAVGGAVAGPLLLLGAGAVKSASRFVKGMTPSGKVAKLTEEGRQELAESIQQDLQKQDISVDEAQSLMDDYGLTLADLGEQSRTFARGLGLGSDAAAGKIQRFFGKRQEETRQRVIPPIARAAGWGEAPSGFKGKLADLSEQARAAAGEQIQEAYKFPIQLSRDIYREVADEAGYPVWQKMVERAHSIVNAKRLAKGQDAIPSDEFDINPGQMLPGEVAHALLQGMKEVKEQVFKDAGGSAARRFKDRIDRVQAAMGKQNPKLGAALDNYASEMSIERAADAGRKTFAKNADNLDEVLRDVGEMNTAEKNQWKLAALGSLESMFENASTEKDLVKRLHDVPNFKTLMRELFGDAATTENVFKMLKQEGVKNATYKALMGKDVAARVGRSEGQRAAEEAASMLGGMAGWISGIVTPFLGGMFGRKAARLMPGAQQVSPAQQKANTNMAGTLMGGNIADVMTAPNGMIDPGTSPLALTPRIMGGLLAADPTGSRAAE